MYFGHNGNLILVAGLFAYEENAAIDCSCYLHFFRSTAVLFLRKTIHH